METSGNKFYLPEGLPLNPVEPEWLSTAWPMNLLTTSIGSVVLVMAIFLGLAALSFLIAYLSKTFLKNRFLKGLGKFTFIITGVGLLAAIGISFMSWSQPASVSDAAMGVQVTRTTDWLKSQSVSADNQAVWDLVCFYYDDKNSNCREQTATVYYRGNPEKVRLEQQPDGNIILLDYENRAPLIG